MEKQSVAKKMNPMSGKGYSFNNQKDADAYHAYQKDKRARSAARKDDVSPEIKARNKSDAEVRKHFRGENQRFSSMKIH